MHYPFSETREALINRKRAILQKARPPKPKEKHPAYISAEDLRAIVLEAIEWLQHPALYDRNNFSTDMDGNSAGIWSEEAVIFSELGHVYRAANTVFALKAKKAQKPYHRRESNISRAAELIDAQVRFLCRDSRDHEITMVTLGVAYGRKSLIEAFDRVAERLKGGDSMLLEPVVHKPVEEPKKEGTGRRRRPVPEEGEEPIAKDTE